MAYSPLSTDLTLLSVRVVAMASPYGGTALIYLSTHWLRDPRCREPQISLFGWDLLGNSPATPIHR